MVCSFTSNACPRRTRRWLGASDGCSKHPSSMNGYLVPDISCPQACWITSCQHVLCDTHAKAGFASSDAPLGDSFFAVGRGPPFAQPVGPNAPQPIILPTVRCPVCSFEGARVIRASLARPAGLGHSVTNVTSPETAGKSFSCKICLWGFDVSSFEP